MGGQAGTQIEVTTSGELLEEASEMVFSHPGIVATAKLDANGAVVPKQYVVTIAADCPPGVHEARMMTNRGLSTSRVFSVSKLPEVVQSGASASPESAMTLEVNSICNAVMPVRAVNHYRFEARKDQRVIIDCAAQGIDSKLNPVLIIADSEARDLRAQRRGDLLDFTAPEDGTYMIKVHDLTFNGGDTYFYRLALQELAADAAPERLPSTAQVNAFSWPPLGLPAAAALTETEPNNQHTETQSITLPCDIAGTFYPAADVDRFEFTAKKGEKWWVEVGSERLGFPTDPSLLVQRVNEEGEGETLVDVVELRDIASPVTVSTNAYSYNGPPYNAGSADVLGVIDIPADGRYRLQLTDLFGGTRNDPRNAYRMVIRKAAPDFVLVAWAMHMTLRNGDRNALSKPMALRPGSTMPLEVIVVRRDGFDGEIEISMDNLPDGVTAHGLKIPAGGSRGIMLVTADEGAPQGYARASFVGRSEIDGESVTRNVHLASMAWPVKDGWSEIPSPRLLADVPVSVSGVEVAPLTIAAREKKVWEVAAGEKLTIPLVHYRRSEFSGAAMSVKTFGAGFDKNSSFDLPLTADSSEAVLDLSKLKTPPGDYMIAFYGSAVAKYVDPPAPNAAAGAAPAKPRDIVDIIVSEPIAIRVMPAEKS